MAVLAPSWSDGAEATSRRQQEATARGRLTAHGNPQPSLGVSHSGLGNRRQRVAGMSANGGRYTKRRCVVDGAPGEGGRAEGRDGGGSTGRHAAALGYGQGANLATAPPPGGGRCPHARKRVAVSISARSIGMADYVVSSIDFPRPEVVAAQADERALMRSEGWILPAP